MTENTHLVPTSRSALIADSIRELRARRDLTQQQLAVRVGITQPTLSKVERGEARVSLELLLKILTELGVSIGELLGHSSKTLYSSRECDLIEGFRSLDEESRSAIEVLVRSRAAVSAYSVLAAYDDLFGEAQRAIEDGRLLDAYSFFDEAWSLLEDHDGPAELRDRAFCNRAALSICLGQLREHRQGLRAVLLANRSHEACFLAAKQLGTAFMIEGEPEKGLLYARLALTRARKSGREEWTASAHCLIGGLLAGQDRFSEAAAAYRESVRILPRSVRWAILEPWINLGFCEIKLGRVEAGLRLLRKCLDRAREGKNRRSEMFALLDLARGRLELGDCKRALECAELGQALARKIGEADALHRSEVLLEEIRLQQHVLEAGGPWRAGARRSERIDSWIQSA